MRTCKETVFSKTRFENRIQTVLIFSFSGIFCFIVRCWFVTDICNTCYSFSFEKRGWSWTYKEEVLVVSILKRSPRSFAFLWTLFTPPSRRILQSLLNTVQFRTDINAHVFSVLKYSVQARSDKDCVCSLMFDKMLIKEHLHFNQKIDCIEGILELVSHGRTSNIANNALVFMLHGLH